MTFRYATAPNSESANVQDVATTTKVTPAQLALFRACFSGLAHVYGTYDVRTGRVYQIKQPVTDDVLRRHIAGQQPYGVYLLVNNRTRAVVVDFDIADLDRPMSFVSAARRYDLPAYIERSKSKGHHVWIFFGNDGVLAAKARLVVQHILDELGYAGTEIFPKHDRLDTRATFGNFIFAPLFGVSVVQGRTVFVRPDDPTRPLTDQWAFLESIRRVPESQLDAVIELNQLAIPRGAVTGVPVDQPSASFSHLGLAPCAQRMLQEGVCQNQRVACFRLAVQLKRVGLPSDLALHILTAWAAKNRPIEGKRIITPDEIARQTALAYDGAYRGFGCEDAAIQPYCSPGCRIRAARARDAATASCTTGHGATAPKIPPEAPRQDVARHPVHKPLTERNPTMAERAPQRPVKEFRAGTVKVAIWQNEVEQNGQRSVRHSIRIGKRYFDRQQNAWLDSEYLFVNDLPRLRLLVEKAFEFIALKEPDADSADAPNGTSAEPTRAA